MSLILKQETASSIPAPPSGKTTISVDLNGVVNSVGSNGIAQQFPTVAGSNTQVFYNNQGAIAGDANLTYIASTGTLTAKNVSVTGTLIAGDISVSSIANGTSNVDIVGVSGNVTTSVGGNANIFVVTGTGANVNGTLSSSGNVIANTKLLVGTSSTTLINPVAVFTGAGATYSQLSMQNPTGSGSADITVYGNNGDDTQSWADMGFTGNSFSDANYTVTSPGDGYFFVQGNSSFGGNMVIATGNTGTTKDIIFATGGFLTGNIKARLYNANGTFSVAGNVSGGNVVTTGAISSTGNVTAGNISTAGSITATGNIQGGNLTTTGIISTTGNANVGNLNIPAGGNIVGDFSSPTINSRTMIVTSTTNSPTGVYIAPSGTANVASIQVINSNSGTNASKLVLSSNGSTDLQLASGVNGSGTYLPLSFYNNGVSQMRLYVSGGFYVGQTQSDPGANNAQVQANLTAGNISTAGQIVSSLATGTAPLTVSSTTLVPNLYVSRANVSDYDTVTTATTGTYYPAMFNAVTGNLQNYANSGLSFNAANAALTATTFVGALNGAASSATIAGTVTNNAQPNITSTGTLASLSVTANANVGNLNSGAVVSVVGNVIAGNLTTAGLVTATGNVIGGNLTTAGIVSATGGATFAGNVAMSSKNITGLADPVNAQDAATKNYVDTTAQGLHVHAACNAATTGTLATATGGTMTYNNGSSGVGANLVTTGSYTTIDGVNIASVGTRILVKNEANAAWNGVYTYTSSTVITRATDFDQPAEVAGGDFLFVTSGTTQSDTGWVQTTDAPVTIGTSPIVFSQFSGAGTYTAGTGLTLTGTTFSVNNAQPQITSVGTLTALSVSGNANIGNIGTGGLITATGNLIAGNISTAGLITVTGNANVGNLGVAGLITATGNIVGSTKLLIGTGTSSLTNPVAVFQGSGATYDQLALFNSTGTGSADLITYGNNGDDTQSWADIGFTGNTFSDANYTVTSAGDGYFFVQGNASFGGNMVIATGNIGTTKDIIFATGGFQTGNIKARLYNANGTFSVTGNVTGGNLTTAGLITATGNITTSANVTGTHYGAATGLTGIPGANVTGTLSVPTSSYAATVSSAAQANITSLGTLTGLTVSGTTTISGNAALTTTNITTGANTTAGYLTGNFTLTAGSRLQATYADLAEKYVADATYTPGTVLVFGGDHEVTISTETDSFRVAGVVTTNAAYTMNSALEAEYVAEIALQGRVPCKVLGPVYKGDLLVSAGNGYAVANNIARAGTIIGKSLENFNEASGVIEVAVGRF